VHVDGENDEDGASSREVFSEQHSRAGADPDAPGHCEASEGRSCGDGCIIEAQMQRRTKNEIYKHQRNMEQVRLAGRMRRYINSALMRNEAVGLSPNLTISVPVVDAAGEQVVDVDGNQVAEKEAVIDSVQHMQHKQWMPREGLEGERKWMSDTESVADGECLLSFFVKTPNTDESCVNG
jgi:hypothetical protein